jgi:hypothetical protein
LANFGYANIYLSDTVQNPAIAAAMAIIASLVVAITVHWTTKKANTQSA